MENYKISPNTLAVIPIGQRKTKVYEKDDIIIVNQSARKIIEDNCEYYGSTYDLRKKNTVKLIGVTHKSPIIIEDSTNMIFFPTQSPRLNTCSWISLNNLEYYGAYGINSIVKFYNNFSIQLPISKEIISNQVLRATRLESVTRKRKEDLAKISNKNI